jgi:hypothetical protein
MSAPEEVRRTIARFCELEHPAQVRLLAELVEAPSANPPVDCAPHAHVGRYAGRQPMIARLVALQGYGDLR